ncbi:MAG TPA: ATP-dependent zinc metalloprotease FtsH [Acidimicrobiales bacterium]|nr:ATP-dependent zinc metalloprotease FtsH [Acidimicrobiales bacterium]
MARRDDQFSDDDQKDTWFQRLKDSGRGPTVLLGGLVVFLIVVYAVVLTAVRPNTPGREMTIDELQREVRDREITEVTLLSEDRRLVGTDAEGDWWVGTGNFDNLAQSLLTEFTQQGVRTRIDTQTSKAMLKLATQFLLPAMSIAVMFTFFYQLRRRDEGGTAEYALLGRSKHRRYTAGQQADVTFADVAGLNEAKQELYEVKEFLSDPETFERVGAKPPRGVLLVGPPGCGKTLLAKAVAGEAGVPFFSVSASSFVEMLAGVGPSRVRDLFRKAKAAAPCIIFIDEVDAMGRSRSIGDTLNPEGESTLNELLVQLDGFDTTKRVVLIAATNRPDILDSALMRKGRFDRQIVIDEPDLTGRLAIFKVHSRGKPLAEDVDLQRFARRTVGLSGADIAAIMNEAATLAARRRQTVVTNKEIGDAIDRVVAGPELHSRMLGPDEKLRVAYHEAGHALVGWVLNSLNTVDKVSVVARGHSLGLTWSLPLEDRRLKTCSQYQEEIAMAVAGRTAELIVYNDPSGGSQTDLARATQLAHFMVFELGMSDAIGPVSLGPRTIGASLEHSDELMREADAEVRRILEKADERAREVITAYRDKLDLMASRLVAQETLEHSELQAILGDLPKGLPRTVATA